MQNIEPYNHWSSLYDAAQDKRSPFFGRKYHESLCTHTIYNYYIHPQWDDIGSDTLYLKILYAAYRQGYCIIELMGEWNDCLYNDIMYLKRNIAEPLIEQGIKRFILIGENVLNFHASENDYYQEWREDVAEGWIAALNLRRHVLEEFQTIYVDKYIFMDSLLQHFPWRTFTPQNLFYEIERITNRRLSEHIF